MLRALLVALLLGAASSLKLPTQVSSRRDALAIAGMGAAALAFAPQQAQAAAGAKNIFEIREPFPDVGKNSWAVKQCGAGGKGVEKPCNKAATLWGPEAGLGAKAPEPPKKK